MKKNILSRAINKLYTRIIRYSKQHVVREKDITLNYLLFESNNNKNLIVCFPAFADKGAKYNYVHTLKGFQATKLFLLDNFAENGRGNYLLGDVECMVKSLIDSIILKLSPEKIIFVGSSKGGYSALYYSFFFPEVNVCIAAPQYFLGDYLNNKEMMPNLKAIIGLIEKEKIYELNNRLKNLMVCSMYKPHKVYLHYSDKEHTYKEHIIDMVSDLKNNDIEMESDVEHYENHGDLVFYYPSYLKETIKRILGE